jgi:hypothetical protein
MIFLINSHAAGHPRKTIKEQSNGCADSVWLNCRANEKKVLICFPKSFSL